MELFARFLIALAVSAAGVLLYWSWNAWQLSRLRRAATQAPGLEPWQPGRPGILYFTTPECAPCRTTQRPALERLKSEQGDGIQIIEVDASAQAAVADHWGVLSVPTTFILDEAGTPRYVNHGVANAEKLKRQLAGARPPAARPAGATTLGLEP